MAMKPGAAVLAALRASPGMATAAWGFVVRGQMLGNAVGGGCTLACGRYRESSVYEIAVGAGAGDFYIPFGHGQARHCDVPQGQPNGTLVVTFPMNGCALEVREIDGNNRFYHDSDGNSMPALPPGVQKIRIVAADYEGPEQTAETRFPRYVNPDIEAAGNFEHSIISVKRGGQWEVYGSTCILVNDDGWQIKDRVPYHLGDFAD